MMPNNEKLNLRFQADDGIHAVVIEVDNRVAYAYLLEGDRVIGDVWLYNVDSTPETVDWHDREQMPFLNPRPYCTGERIPDLRQDVHCNWSGDEVEIVSDGSLVARLAPGAKPGWSRLALKNGPLAKTLEEP
jgi:hypothetical protein